jgi:hypothetical protein
MENGITDLANAKNDNFKGNYVVQILERQQVFS